MKRCQAGKAQERSPGHAWLWSNYLCIRQLFRHWKRKGLEGNFMKRKLFRIQCFPSKKGERMTEERAGRWVTEDRVLCRRHMWTILDHIDYPLALGHPGVWAGAWRVAISHLLGCKSPSADACSTANAWVSSTAPHQTLRVLLWEVSMLLFSVIFQAKRDGICFCYFPLMFKLAPQPRSH